MQVHAEKLKVGLVRFADDDGVWTSADVQSLRQIVLNLISNAVKFSPKNSEVRIAYGRDGTTGAPWISVVDCGCGIPPETLSRLGNPFVQAEDVYARRNQGTGLGLAISFRLAETMGAAITIESKVGEGTEVRLSFPPS